MTDEQNEIDIRRMSNKRGEALKLLDEFKLWFFPAVCNQSSSDAVIAYGITRDILTGTEDEVDRLIAVIADRNEQAALDKLSKSL